MEEIIESYNQAEYYIDGFDEPLKIGEIHVGVNELLKRSNVSSWCFITAWNPLSVELSSEENTKRNKELFAALPDYQIIKGEGRDPSGKWTPEQSFLALGISRKEATGLSVKFGQRAIIYSEINQPAELIETLFTMGNCEIIRLHKTAFLCSRKIPAGIILKCYDWAIEQREAGNCVISGFHSTIEKDVLHYLLKGTQPIILALARGLKKKVDTELEQALSDNRLLIITPFNQSVTRVSEKTSFQRNQVMTELADSITVGFASSQGSLEKLITQVDKEVHYIS